MPTEKDILEDIACTHSFAMKANERSEEQANRLSSMFKHFETIALLFEAQVTEMQ